MTMHLEGPWLTTTGKKKGKHKFRSADLAKKSRQLKDSWKELQEKWGIDQEEKRRKKALSSNEWKPEKINYRGIDSLNLPSLNTFPKGAVSSKPSPVYTGDKIIGIGTLHKSNAVPIFSNDEAVDISRMRR